MFRVICLLRLFRLAKAWLQTSQQSIDEYLEILLR